MGVSNEWRASRGIRQRDEVPRVHAEGGCWVLRGKGYDAGQRNARQVAK